MSTMPNNIETYKIWAPDNALWTAWAKPVLFMNPPLTNIDIERKEINWISELSYDTMIILDLPGKEGVEESLSLAKLGYRPVPIYNGVQNPPRYETIVDVRDIVSVLYGGAGELNSLNIKSDAPPVFLLDSNRMNGHSKQHGIYDNRWCVFPQDMPSASFLTEHKIKRIIVRSQYIQNDLAHIVRRYQEHGIKIYICSNGILKETDAVKPSKFKSLRYRFGVILGLKRNANGGFGKEIPEQMTSDTEYRGYGYYRMG